MDSVRPSDVGPSQLARGHRPDTLRATRRGAGCASGGQEVSATRVQVVPGGPVLVPGPVQIEMPDGGVVESDRFMVAIVPCSRSDNYPLCDTTHRRCRRVANAAASPGPFASTSAPDSTTP